MSTYTPLPSEFDFDHFHFRQINRTGDVVLLEKIKTGISTRHFEVAVVRKHEAREAFGKFYPPRERMPPAEVWGREAWSYSDESAARSKFDQLTSRTPTKAARLVNPDFVGRAEGWRQSQSSAPENRIRPKRPVRSNLANSHSLHDS